MQTVITASYIPFAMAVSERLASRVADGADVARRAQRRLLHTRTDEARRRLRTVVAAATAWDRRP